MLAQVIDGVWGYEGGGKSARVGDGGMGALIAVRGGQVSGWKGGVYVCMLL